jgi:aconitate hydratase
MSIFEAADRYKRAGVPTIILAGREYGSGSSRDWAAKGPYLQGVRAVIAESYERIHRSNLVGMGVLPLQFQPGESVETLRLSGHELFEIGGVAEGIRTGFSGGKLVPVRARRSDGTSVEFQALVRIDTPKEAEYYLHGGILPYVLRQLIASE